MSNEREQQLVDIMFQIAYNIAHYGKDWSDAERNAYISDQLNKCGFTGKPVGMYLHFLG